MKKPSRKFENNRLFVLNEPHAPRLSPALAQEIGLNESLIFLQLEFLIAIRGEVIDGERSVQMSLSHINEEFPFLSKATIGRAVNSLLKTGLIKEPLLSMENHNKSSKDEGRWFAINLAKAGELKSISLDKKLSIESSQNEMEPSQYEPGVSHFETGSSQNETAHVRNIRDMETMENLETHTQEEKPAAVCVEKKGEKKPLSRHGWETVFAWAKYRKSIGGKIEPFAVAKARFDDGLADEEIGAWIASRPPQTTAPLATPPEIDLPGESPPELLEQFLAALVGRLNDPSITTWFKPIKAMSRGDTTVCFLVPDASFRDWITQNYDYAVEGALEAIGLAGYRFEFVVPQGRSEYLCRQQQMF
jgi:hypothetical protein